MSVEPTARRRSVYIEELSTANDQATASTVSSTTKKVDDETAKRKSRRKWILALVLLMTYIGLTVISSQLTTSAFIDPEVAQYKAPYLFIWCKLFVRILAFPTVFIIQIGIQYKKFKTVDTYKLWSHCTAALRDDKGNVKVRLIARKFLPMSITMLLLQVGWVVGFVYAPGSLVSALYAGSVAFSYILSWLVLKKKMLIIKGAFVVISFLGIFLVSISPLVLTSPEDMHVGDNATTKLVTSILSDDTSVNATLATTTPKPEPFDNFSVFIGVLCGLVAAVFYSLNSLTFKLAYPKADFLQVALIISVTSFIICTIYLPVPLIINKIGKEQWVFSKMPWTFMIFAWLTSLLSSIANSYGLALSNPFFISVGEVLIVALMTGIDATVRQFHLTSLQIGGTLLIGLSFVFMVMPDDWLSIDLAAIVEQIRKKIPHLLNFPVTKIGGVDRSTQTEEEEQDKKEQDESTGE